MCLYDHLFKFASGQLLRHTSLSLWNNTTGFFLIYYFCPKNLNSTWEKKLNCIQSSRVHKFSCNTKGAKAEAEHPLMGAQHISLTYGIKLLVEPKQRSETVLQLTPPKKPKSNIPAAQGKSGARLIPTASAQAVLCHVLMLHPHRETFNLCAS